MVLIQEGDYMDTGSGSPRIQLVFPARLKYPFLIYNIYSNYLFIPYVYCILAHL